MLIDTCKGMDKTHGSRMGHRTLNRLVHANRSVKAHYYLGQAYEHSGWTRKAIEQYETILDIWKNADEGIALVEDARARPARLKGET